MSQRDGKPRRGSDSKKPRLTEGPVSKTLMRLALPMMVGIVGMVAFNLVDTFFVGRLGTLELAAMSFTFPVVLVVMSISRGLGVGATAVLARAIGEGDHHKVRRMTTDALLLSWLVVVAFVVAGLLTIDPLFRLLGAGEEVLPLIKKYMRIWYLGMPFVVIPMVGNSAIRATGDTKTPSAIMLAAILVNASLDPLFIFGIGFFPRLELAGAALATVIARATTFAISLLVLSRREKMLTLERVSLREIYQTWKQVLYLGLPAAATYIIIPLSTGIITRLIAGYGPEHVAGFGVATRIEMFALTIVMALSVVLIPYVGQNVGAGRVMRVRQGVHYSQLFSLAWGLLLFLVFLLLARPIASIFNKNPDVVSTTALYLSIVSLSYGAQGIIELNASTFNALKKPLPAAALSLIRMFAFYVPLAFLGSRLLGLKGIFGAVAIANFGTAGISTIWVRRKMKLQEDARLGVLPADVPARE
jgi:putative MATE family efflux protein